MSTTPEIPQEIRDAAAAAGVDVDALVAKLAGEQAKQPAPAEFRTVPAETPQEKLERENAVLAQELQQTRQLAQTAREGRVVGSGGVGPTAEPEIPHLGSIEPGIRFAVRNGLMDLEQVGEKFGQVVVDLFKSDMGGGNGI